MALASQFLGERGVGGIAVWLRLEPLDVLMFRDSRPFTGGESHRARSVFPPSPLTFQGAIRSVLLGQALSRAGKTFADYRNLCVYGDGDEMIRRICAELGTGSKPGRLTFTGPFLARVGEGLLFPVPRDLIARPEAEGRKLRGRRVSTGEEHGGSVSEPFVPGTKDGQERVCILEGQEGRLPAGTWLSGGDLASYLRGEMVDERARAPIFHRELRAGIALDPDRRTVAAGMLYVAEYIRLEGDLGFLCEVKIHGEDGVGEDLLSPLRTPGVLQLGGEARACRYQAVAEDPLKVVRSVWTADASTASSGQLLKLYLATPAIFRNGWLPDFINPATLEGTVGTCGQVRLKLVAGAVGKPLSIGGWDLILRRPRPLVRAVPPGSVYFFQLLKGSVQAVTELFHGTSTMQGLGGAAPGSEAESLGEPQDLARFGFGLTFVGVTAPEKG